MRLVPFTAIHHDDARYPVRVNPESVLGLSPPRGPNGPMLDRCEIRAPDGPMVVVGSVDEVAAALEGAVPAASGNMAAAAKILTTIAADSIEWDPIDRALGLNPDDATWEDTAAALHALAARLRGGTP